jgi:tryptophan 2,3-dioxygenase
MRAYVCAQCHVEYYFKGTEKRLTYPWDKGLKADEILAYYEETIRRRFAGWRCRWTRRAEARPRCPAARLRAARHRNRANFRFALPHFALPASPLAHAASDTVAARRLPRYTLHVANANDELSKATALKAVTYGSYLRVDELLALQHPRSNGPEHDELLFIIIHQVYELWFKELLHELDYARRLLEDGESHRVQHTFKRILTILKVLVAQLDILETMTPLEFLSFRERLEAASGFQSDQFRQLEFALGLKSADVVKRFPPDSRGRTALEQRFREASLWDAFVHYLAREGYPVPNEILTRDVTSPIQPSDALQHALIDLYRRDAKNAELCERLVDLDEGMQEWRYRHVKMVERTIGTKPGSGGSQGAAYLRGTLAHPLFPDLWAIRGRM